MIRLGPAQLQGRRAGWRRRDAQGADGRLAMVTQPLDRLVEQFRFVFQTRRGVTALESCALVSVLMSSCISGNTDFWRNDPFTRTSHPAPGDNLFGADRAQKRSDFSLDASS
jgi:hypothetical protein